MDRQKLNEMMKKGPIRVTMNDGSSFDIPGPEFATASDIAAAVLYRANDGKYRHAHLPLVTMCAVEPLEASN